MALTCSNRGPKAKAFSGSSGDKPAGKGEDTPSKADPKATKPDGKADEERQATPMKGSKAGKVPGQRGNTTPKASGSPGIVPKAAAAKGRGRPPRSIVQEATEMVASFSTSEVTAVLWWSGEQKTQLKKVKEVKATFDSRIQKASGPDAVATPSATPLDRTLLPASLSRPLCTGDTLIKGGHLASATGGGEGGAGRAECSLSLTTQSDSCEMHV